MHMKSTSEIRDEKFAMVRRWESSGMKQRVFCNQECIPFHHFYYWLKIYRDENKLTPSTGKFINLTSSVKEIQGSIYAEVIFKNGNSIRFHQQVGGQELKQLAG